MAFENFQINNSVALKDNIEKETQSKLDEIQKTLSDLKVKKERLTKMEIQRLEAKYEKESAQSKTKIFAQFKNKIQPDSKVLLLKKKGELLNELLGMIEDDFFKVNQGDEYKKLFQILIEDIKITLKSDLSFVKVHPDDKGLAISLLDSNVKVIPDLKERGIYGSDATEHKIVDNTLRGWFRKKKQNLRDKLVKNIDSLYDKKLRG